MTASKTPKLGLMNPVGSDPFQTADFSTTMGILDQNPGILVVPNQASRPTGWTYQQHGRRVWQTDEGVDWIWSQPSSGTPGYWRRVSGRGHLANGWSGPQITTTTTNYAAGVTMVELTNVVVPGGRMLKIEWNFEWIGNSNGCAISSYWENNVRIIDIHHTGTGFAGGNNSMPHAQGFSLMRWPGESQQTMNFRITMAAHSGFGGSSWAWGCNLFIIEL